MRTYKSYGGKHSRSTAGRSPNTARKTDKTYCGKHSQPAPARGAYTRTAAHAAPSAGRSQSAPARGAYTRTAAHAAPSAGRSQSAPARGAYTRTAAHAAPSAGRSRSAAAYRPARRAPAFSTLVWLCLAVLLTFGGVTAAKYVFNLKLDAIFTPKRFVFQTSLKENTADTPYFVYDDAINFSVKNNDRLNFSETNIDYSYSISVYNGAVVNSGSGTLPVSPAGSSQPISITGLTNGVTYAVTVQATAPYSKKIELYFKKVEINEASYYSVTHHGDGAWSELDIYTGECSTPITITYTGYPDNTDSRVDWQHNGTGGEGKIEKLESYSHYKLIFFNAEGFSLTQDGNPLQYSA